MDTSNWSSRQGHRLLQLGMLVFLIALLVGLAVPKFAVPRLGLSAHLIGIMQGLFLMVAGLLWPRLQLTRAMARAAFWLAVYGCFAAWTANVLAGVWGAGNSMLTIAAGAARSDLAREPSSDHLTVKNLKMIHSQASTHFFPTRLNCPREMPKLDPSPCLARSLLSTNSA